MIARLGILGLVAACSSSKPAVTESHDKPPAPTPTATPTEPTTTGAQRRGMLRIDAEPGGKRFQGVWLELEGGKRWVLDYRPREFWKSFENADVIVTGECYQPFGQAIMATHFRVDQLRFANPKQGVSPILEVGPAITLQGKFVNHDAPKGSKREGSSETRFHVGDTAYKIHGSIDPLPAPGTESKIKARVVTIDMSYVATTGGPAVFILDINPADEDPAHAPKIVPCP